MSEIINKEIFEKEVAICQEMSQKQKSCCWGKCENCGVIPLLHKLYKGEVLENEKDIEKIKESFLNQRNFNFIEMSIYRISKKN